jgi:predicted metal-dependent hydrolase
MLTHLRSLVAQQPDMPDGFDVQVNGKTVRVAIKIVGRAKRMTLRVKAATCRVVLTIPPATRLARAQEFVRAQTQWLHQKLTELPEPAFMRHGAPVMIRGETCIIRHVSRLRGVVCACLEGGVRYLDVPGRAEHAGRKVRDYIKKQARLDIEAAVARYAAALNVSVGRISLKDTKSRWGSCSARGDLSFSFRLVMAPPFVLDYVAAHELAHRREMNHSAQFWLLLNTIAPHTKQAELWLKMHGKTLHRFHFTF